MKIITSEELNLCSKLYNKFDDVGYYFLLYESALYNNNSDIVIHSFAINPIKVLSEYLKWKLIRS